MKTKQKYSSGITLLELAVYLFILGFVSTSIYTILIGSMRNYQLASTSTELQSSVQSASFRLSRELEESSPNSIVISSSGTIGVSFESARAGTQMQYVYPGNSIGACNNSTAGIAGGPCWHQYICYYLDTDPSTPGELALYRKVQTHTDNWVASTPPNPSAFKSDTTFPKTTIARHLSSTAFSLTRVGTKYLLNITANHMYGAANSFTTQMVVNIKQ